MKLIQAVVLLAFAIGMTAPTHAYPVVQADSYFPGGSSGVIAALSVLLSPRNSADISAVIGDFDSTVFPDISPVVVPWTVPGSAMPVVFNGNIAASNFRSHSGADAAPSPMSLPDASPATFGADARLVNTDASVPTPTAATLALVGLALVALGLSRRKRTVHIQLG